MLKEAAIPNEFDLKSKGWKNDEDTCNRGKGFYRKEPNSRIKK